MKKKNYSMPETKAKKMQLLELIAFSDTEGGGAPGYGGGTGEGGISEGNVKEEKNDWDNSLW